MRAWLTIRFGLPAVALAVTLCGAGCDWRDFDTLAGQTPVVKVTAPSGFQSAGDFASLVLPVAPPLDGSVPAWFLTSATESLGVALIRVGANGAESVQNLQSATLDNLGTNNPLTALAEIPGTGIAFLGAPSLNSLVTINLATQEIDPFLVPAGTASEGELGAGVAAGNLTGSAAPDLAAISTSTVHLFVDGSPAQDLSPSLTDIASCPIVLGNVPPGERANRAMVMGPLLATGPAIAIGVPGAAAPGTVVFYAVATGAVTCAGILNAPSVADAGFGAALALGDFDGDGLPDLLVGAPPNTVYLYKGPLTLPAAPTATVPKPANSAEFGASLAALNLDGKKGDEALVGDPGATLGGVSGAGDVTVYTGPTLAALTPPITTATPRPTPLVLADHNPGTGEGYGSAVAGLSFCTAAPCTGANLTPLPLVGAPGAAFTYFTLGPADPRVK
jgi:hypothetical protein